MAYFIMIGLLVAAVAYSMAGEGRLRPAVSSSGKTALIVCGGIVGMCVLLLLAVMAISASHAHP